MRPKRIASWLLTAVAALFATIAVTVAICMSNPIRWDGLGIFGALALFFPLHLLVLTLLAAALALLAGRCNARLASRMLGSVVQRARFRGVRRGVSDAPALALEG